MAKNKKQEVPPPGAPAWMATFSDLMNLLLCFFVLLFAMSSVDAEKFDQIAASMSSSFSIFKGGGASLGDGTLVSAGTSQLSNLDEYYSSMGQQSTETDGENYYSYTSQAVQDAINDANLSETAQMYDTLSEQLDNSNLNNYIEAAIDSSGTYIEILISGTFLFDSGKADIKTDSLPVLSKLGDVLKTYEGNLIEIIGHTDNVPLSSTNIYINNDILSCARAISAKNYLVDVKGLDVTNIKWSGKGEYDPIASNLTQEGRDRNRRIEIRIYNMLNSQQ